MKSEDEKQTRGPRVLTREEENQLMGIYSSAVEDTTEGDVSYVLAAVAPKLTTLDPEVASQAMLAKQVGLLRDMLAVRTDGAHSLSWADTQTIAAALFYFVMPFDLIPDCVPEEGFLDDCFVVSLCMSRLRPLLEERLRERGEAPEAFGLR